MSAANYMNVINGSIVMNVTAVTVVMDVIQPPHQIDNSSRTVISFLSMGLSERIASDSGTYTTSLFRTPIITLRCPCMMRMDFSSDGVYMVCV